MAWSLFWLCVAAWSLLGTCAACPAGAEMIKGDSPEAQRLRNELVESWRGVHVIEDQDVREAMRRVPRHLFVPKANLRDAYEDHPLPIGYGQTISQPFIVAYMTQTARLDRAKRVLEIGTGSGYQAAVAAELAGEVYSIEIIPELAASAADRLKDLGYANVTVRPGDGYYGWKEHAPFDTIIVTAAAPHIPPPLVEQLKPGGRMVIPVGGYLMHQSLLLIIKDENGEVRTENLMPVIFVPLVGGPHAGK